jgi:dienelactone hydrolase
VLALLLLTFAKANAQQIVHFPTMPASSIQLDGYLYEPETAGAHPHPAVVFLHGCGGLISNATHMPEARQTAWAKVFNDRGYTVLMVDSFTPRGVKSVCSPKTWSDEVYAARPHDAYAGLAYLQSRPDIDPKHIGVMGWSNGGGVVLFSVDTKAPHDQPGFAAAVALYPGSCSTNRLGNSWSSAIPLLVLVGAKDVWTPAAPCQAALGTSRQTQLKIYPDSYHDFDWPGMAVHSVPSFTTSSGVVPIEGENPTARADALKIVPEFLQRYLGR